MYNRVKRCINRKDRLVKHKHTFNSLKKNFFNNLKKNVITYANVRQARYIIWMRITRMRSKSVLTGNRCSRPSFVIISTDYDQLRLRCIYGSSSGGCSGGGGEMKGLGGEEGKGGNVQA